MPDRIHQNFRDRESRGIDDYEWAERAEYWRNFQPVQKRRGRRAKFHYREPMVLCGHGVRIRIDRGTLLIRDGFTHYPQKREEIRLFRGDANLPDRIVVLDGSGGISFDALEWMADQEIQFVRLDWRGQASIVGANSGYSASPELVEAQLAIRNTRKSVQIAQWLIGQKIKRSVEAIRELIPKSEKREIAISRLNNSLRDIGNSRRITSISRIQGVEGGAAAAYFQAWLELPLNWTGLKRRPIPADWHKIGPRKMGWRSSDQNAHHPINAMLNYGYGILATKMRTQVVTAGLDPTLGIMHGTWKNTAPLAYDLMEPLRPVVDQNILAFALSHTFTPADFAINQRGGCRLNPQMARAMLKVLPDDTNESILTMEFIQRIVPKR